MNLWAKLHKYLPVIGVLLFVFIIWKIGFNNLINSLVKVNLIYLIVFVLLLIPILLLQIFKWYYILKLQGINISFLEAVKFHLVSLFLGAITTGRLGVFSKIFFLKKTTKKELSYCIPSVILDKFLDFFLLVLFSFFGSILLLKMYNLNLYVGLLLVIFVISLLFLFNKNLTKFFIRWFYIYFIPNKFKDLARSNFNIFYEVMPPYKKIIPSFLITLLSWLILYSQNYILLIGFNIKIPYLYFIFIFPIIILFSLIPITISGIGIREFLMIILFSGFNIDNSNLIAFSIVSSFLTNFFTFVGYMFYAKKVNLNLQNE